MAKLNASLWPNGYPTAIAIRDGADSQERLILRAFPSGIEGGASIGWERPNSDRFFRLQINDSGSVVYYYKKSEHDDMKSITVIDTSEVI